MTHDELRAAVAIAFEQFKGQSCVQDHLSTYEKLVFEHAFRKGCSVGIEWSKAEACKLIGNES